MAGEYGSEGGKPRPEAILGAALRRAREHRAITLRGFAKQLYRSHSTLVEYERGHRLAPLDVVQAYEVELDIAPGTLAVLHEQAQLELYGNEGPQHPTHAPRLAFQPPNQLPPDVAYFTGREAELATLQTLVSDGPPDKVAISVIAGSAGVGKTALALHLAHRLTPCFPDAQLYVNLHGYEPLQRLTPVQALNRFLRALGVAGEALPSHPDDQIALYRRLLASKSALVILDNASSPDQVRQLLPGIPTCLVIVTSRDRLAGLIAQEGARLLVLDVLPSEKALELLGRIAGAERVGEEPEAAAEVVHLCGYLPLAVGIAATRLVTRPTMSLATLSRRLADEQNRLRELSAGDVEVRASFALSYHGLSPDLAFMFRWLGLVAGPDFAPGLAAVLTDTMPDEAEEMLEALVDAHLLETGAMPGRYRFHDLLRLYARERLQADEPASNREVALRQIFAWYLNGVTAAARVLNPGRRGLLHGRKGDRVEPLTFTRSQAIAWSDTEWVNLVAATHQAAQSRYNDIAWQIPDALYSFASLRRNWMDWREACLVGRAAARDGNDPQAEAWMLTGVGEACRRLRRLSEAIDCLQRALAMHREAGDRRGEAWALSSLGLAHRNLQHFEESIGYVGLTDTEARGYGAASSLSAVRDDPHRFDEAIGYFDQALAIHRELGDRCSEAWGLHDLGSTSSALGHFDESSGYFQQALAIHLETGDRRGEAWALGYLGLAHCCLQRFDQATDCMQGALAGAREVGHYDYGKGLCLRGLGRIYTALERFDEAVDCLQQALATHREIGDRYATAWDLYDLGFTLRGAQGMDAARVPWQEALKIFTELGAVQADEVRGRLGGEDATNPGGQEERS